MDSEKIDSIIKGLVKTQNELIEVRNTIYELKCENEKEEEDFVKLFNYFSKMEIQRGGETNEKHTTK